MVVTNRTTWEVCRIMEARIGIVGRARRPFIGTVSSNLAWETVSFVTARARPGTFMYLVMLAYSLLMLQLRQDRARDWALSRLKTIGEACRAMLNETLRATLNWVVEQVRDKGIDTDHVLAKLRLA